MARKDSLDTLGVVLLIGISMHFAFNQVVIKWVTAGLQPVFFAGIRSLGAVPCIWLWMVYNNRPLRFEPGTRGAGLLIGLIFGLEFLLLFIALDRTTVVHAAILFNAMPLWLALAAHFLLPGEALTRRKSFGLLLAFAGVVWAIAARSGGGQTAAGQATLAGDLCAIAAGMGWAGTAFMARGSAMRRVLPEMQLFWMVLVSGILLTALSPLFGPLLRDWQPVYLLGIAFQIVLVVSFGFILWLWVLSVYPASGVASFSFLTPIFGIAFGWLIFGEDVSPTTLIAGALVATGILMINRAPRKPGLSVPSATG